ncbi:protein FAR1-RELATED SEQUENCE 5-like [Arachis hypogaea]|uniref:protein FAR1-RELATED SEQUENCE 5-like n=1 Tax=Arachis hypogaea TaxID=3818 RepID=UPI000DEC7AEA|nr:protein FAR1-RELATED SEQUENCE 5-like [Arachis hypogaea]
MADRKREHKVVTRCGCLAEMRIKRKDGSGKWYVSRFLDNHNHELVAGKYVDYLRSHRGLSDVEIAHLTSLREVGISIPKIYQSFAAQVGGFNLVRFTKQDMYTEVRKQRSLQNGDVNAAVRYLEGVARVDNRMYWRYKLGKDNNMCDLFWSDGRSQVDYGIFGDVLAFDAIYGRNKYNLPVVVFSGVNHHNQTCVFGAAMVSCETQESYIWVLEKFLECMEGKPPNAVITNRDPAMHIAIHEVFPKAHHRLCAWHLLRNATSNIYDPRFTHLFRQCMLANLEVDEFEAHWDAMLDECGVREVEWVQDLYRRKHAWATTYIRGRFFAGICTTSRCESLHAKLGRFVESRYGILEFVTNFQKCVHFLRDNEDELDFRSSYGTPVLQTEFVELEKSGWTKYTREMFFRYRETLRRCVRVKIFHCGMLVTAGKSILVRMDITSLPDMLVLRRWSKTAKLHYGIVGTLADPKNHTSTYRTRLGAFAQLCTRLGRVACLSDDDFNDYSNKILNDALRLEMKHGLRTAEETVVSVSDVGMKDPIRVRTKGTGRLSQPSTTMEKKRHKCSRAEPSRWRRCHPPNSVLMESLEFILF